MKKSQLNVFGKTLKTCSDDPLTGFFRDGCCNSSVMIKVNIQSVLLCLINF